MSNEEFEEMFGNVPFGTMIIIRDWVNKHYVSKDKIRDKIKELEEIDEYEAPNGWESERDYAKEKLKELLEE